MTPADCATGRAVLVEAAKDPVLCGQVGEAVAMMRARPGDHALFDAATRASLALVQAHQRLEADDGK